MAVLVEVSRAGFIGLWKGAAVVVAAAAIDVVAELAAETGLWRAGAVGEDGALVAECVGARAVAAVGVFERSAVGVA